MLVKSDRWLIAVAFGSMVALCAMSIVAELKCRNLQAQVRDAPVTAETPTAAPLRPRPAMVYVGHVYNVVDGDTIDVEVSYSFRVRLLDCWAPEKHGDSKAEGMASMRNLVKLAAGKDCVVEIPMGTDVKKSLSLDRMLGRVWVKGQDSDLSSQQVEGGFATREK